jgi:hypothetical protein
LGWESPLYIARPVPTEVAASETLVLVFLAAAGSDAASSSRKMGDVVLALLKRTSLIWIQPYMFIKVGI